MKTSEKRGRGLSVLLASCVLLLFLTGCGASTGVNSADSPVSQESSSIVQESSVRLETLSALGMAPVALSLETAAEVEALFLQESVGSGEIAIEDVEINTIQIHCSAPDGDAVVMVAVYSADGQMLCAYGQTVNASGTLSVACEETLAEGMTVRAFLLGGDLKALAPKAERLLLQKEENETKQETVKLNSGYEMPTLGLGTWSLSDAQAEECTYAAIKDGYRLFDTARYYGTEAGIGRAVRRAIQEGLVTRDQVFVTTKVVPSGTSTDYDAQIEGCNKTIGLDYIDLLLIHQSGAGEKQLYRAMERAVEKGIVRSVGISNYYTPKAFDNITEGAAIMPTVVQNENHIFYQNETLRQYVAQYGTFVESWYPFGGRGHTGDSLGNQVIRAIADAHDKTPAQIILRWHLQAGYIVIPGSSNPAHIAENFDVFDFELSAAEMESIAALDTGRRYENW